ncbi:MAG TPA: Type 1 glutamine amidotransferase-like domain-containing protein [Candidatus Eisenbacteria bacterium]|nr:Type 1 glutamine amidotransferase-like domain-containing protein [Candidatus Eisenbacteria bacterium]
MRRLTAVVLGLVLLALPAGAQIPSARLAGVWEGSLKGGRGDQPIAMVVRPRGDHGFVGLLYLGGAELAPIESGVATVDSIYFVSAAYPIAGRIDGVQLACELRVPHGAVHAFTMRHTIADTTALPSGVKAGPSPNTTAVPLAPDSVYLAHAVPLGPTSSVDPCLAHGTLLLVGGGSTQPDIMARLLALAGGAARARILDIPTAAMPSPSDARHLAETMAGRIGVSHVGTLHTSSRDTANADAFVAPLQQATGVWIDGGEGEALLHSYLGTRTERELIALLARGGVVGGTSAGALIWGSRTMSFHAGASNQWAMMQPENLVIGNFHEAAFGLLRNVLIAPHFTEFKLKPSAEKLVAAYPGLLVIGIDQDTALEVHGTVGTVLGRETVTIYDGRPHDGSAALVLKAGDRYDLVRRVVL